MNHDEQPTNLVELMSRLTEPPVPDSIPLTPQTAGWWLFGALAIVVLAIGVFTAWRRWKAGAYRRAALDELASTGDDPERMAGVLRRTALAAFPRRDVASVAGAEWASFLSATGTFPEAAGADLVSAPYRQGTDAKELKQAAEAWIRTHRRPG
jgi:hypothetical protein